MIRPANRQRSHPLLLQSLLLPALFCLPCSGPADSTRIYRCTGEHGQVEFRQGPCVDGSSQQELEIEDVKVGWEAPAATVEVKKRSKKTEATKTSASRANSKKQEEKCFKVEQRLENTNRKLRRGYKAGKGADLRHKRRQYEEYLERFCD